MHVQDLEEAAAEAARSCNEPGAPAAAAFTRALYDAANDMLVKAYARVHRIAQPAGTMHRVQPVPRRLPPPALLADHVRATLVDWCSHPVNEDTAAGQDESGVDAMQCLQQDMRDIVEEQERAALVTQAELLAQVERVLWARLVDDTARAMQLVDQQLAVS